MGHQNVLRVFKVWPRHLDARFANIRAFGAFLVSSEIRDGKVQFVKILSESGRDCVVENPWPEEEIQIMRKVVEVASSERLEFETGRGEAIMLHPVELG